MAGPFFVRYALLRWFRSELKKFILSVCMSAAVKKSFSTQDGPPRKIFVIVVVLCKQCVTKMVGPKTCTVLIVIAIYVERGGEHCLMAVTNASTKIFAL